MDEHDATARARQAGEDREDGPRAAGARARAGAAGAALAVVAVAGTALGAVVLRPGRPLTAKSGGPLDNTAAVILIAVGCLAAGLLVSSRYRQRLGYHQNLPPFEQRLADVVRVVLAAAAMVVPLLLLVMHRFPSGGARDTPSPTRDDTPAHRTLRPVEPHSLHGARGSGGVSVPHIAVAAAIAVLVVVLLVAGYRLWRDLRRTPVPQPASTYRPAEHDVLADAVDSGRRALLDGTDARAAVIACYAAMEASLARSGVARRASDTPQDLLERAAGSGLLAGRHATDLTALFREARYSTHPMDHTHRDRAAGALDAIAAQLAERAAADERRQSATGAPQDAVTRGPEPTAGAHR